MTDDEIIATVATGRIQNFEILIQRYGKKIQNFISRMIWDEDEAKHLAQDVFIKVYENLKYYRSENNFQAFIYKIAKNMSLNWIGKQKRLVFFSKLSVRTISTREFSSPDLSGQKAEEDERQNKLTRALKELKEEQRLALIMKVYLNFSYRQIGDVTGWSVPKIETLISRAKSNLRKKILLQEKNERVV